MKKQLQKIVQTKYGCILPLLIFITTLQFTHAQNAANYSFAFSATASLEDMSSGTTLLIAPDMDDVASSVTNIGFDFFFQGTRQSQFTVNSNGTLRFGATAVSATAYNPLGQSSQFLIASYGTDQRTHVSGKVHYKVTGAAPNRVLVIEWLNMQADYTSGSTAELTYQLKLYETTGIIKMIYGSMALSVAGAADSNSSSPQLGFSSGNTIGAVGTITVAQSGTPAPSYNSASASPVDNPFTAGSIAALSSSSDGSRKMFSFTPPAPLAPASLSFSSVGAAGMTLNWTDNASNEVGYAIYRSTDGINYNYYGSAALNATSYQVTGLYASNMYYWQVYAVSEGALSTAISGNQATNATTAITSNGTGGGLWSDINTWSGGLVPTINDAVTIKDGDLVTVDAASAAYNLTVGEGNSGILQFEQTTARTLTIYDDVTINAGGTFQTNAAGTVTNHNLSLAGNLVNNGTLDFSTNAETAGAVITFTGASNKTFGGVGSITDIRQLTINKGTSSANILELNPTNFTVRGSVTDNVVGGFLVLSNGTFKLSGSFTYTGRMFGSATYSIPATTAVWLNNPNFTISGQNGIATNNGNVRLSAGTWNVGITNSNLLASGTGSSYLVEEGTLNVSGRFNTSNPITYTQSGGTVNLATVGNTGSGANNGTFTLASTSSVFNMSGGNINLVQASTGGTQVDWNVNGTFNYTGGTLNVGTAATVTKFSFRLRGHLPALNVDNTLNGKTVLFGAQANSFGNVTVNSGSTLDINGFVWLIVAQTVTNNGTITGTTTNSRMYYQGNAAQTYTGNGVVTAPLMDVSIDNLYGLTIDPSSNDIITAAVRFFRGGITNGNKLVLGNGGITSGTVQYGSTTNTNVLPAGNFDVSPTFNAGTGGIILSYSKEPVARTTGVEVPSGRVVATMSVNNPNGVIISGGNLDVRGTLTMTLGNIATGDNTLTLGSSDVLPGTLAYVSGTIVGKFSRWISAATGNRDFPVGIAAAKRNVSIDFTSPPSTGGTISVEWVTADGGANGLPLTEGALNVNGTSGDGYWRTAVGNGLTGGAYTGNFAATGINGVTDHTKLVLVERTNASSPWGLAGGTHVTTSGTAASPVLTRTNMSTFADFASGSEEFCHSSVTIASDDADNSICSGTTVTFTALPTNGGTPAYQWKVNGIDVGGEIDSTFASSVLADNDLVSVVMISAGTTCTGSPVASGEIATDVFVIPTADDPADVAACDSYELLPLTVGNYFTGAGGSGTALSAGNIITSTQTIYVYAETGTTPNCTDENSFLVTINATPVADDPADVTACDSYELLPLTVGNYFTGAGGTGTALSAGNIITSTQTIYVYAETGTTPNCTDENNFVVTINVTPVADDPADVTACGSHELFPLTVGNYFTGAGGTGTALSAGNMITSTQTIYVYAETGTTPNCTDENSFDVTIKTVPTITGTVSASRCGTGALTLEATSSSGTIDWFMNPTGGASGYTGNVINLGLSSSKTYYVEASDNGCVSASRTAVTATIDFCSQIQVSQCATTLEAITTPIIANVALGASHYRFEITEGATVYTVTKTTRTLYLANFAFAYGKTYDIRVAISNDGGVSFTAYGSTCTVTSPAIPGSQVRASQCGSTLTLPTTPIIADAVTGATYYRFEITTGADVQTIIKATRTLYMGNFSYAYNTTYGIRVAASADGTNFGAYGSSCNVTASAAPITQVQTSQCGIILATTSTAIIADAISGATHYRFEINGAQYVTKTTRTLYLGNFTHAMGTTYAIRVTYSFDGTNFQAYGPSCNVTSPASGMIQNPNVEEMEEELITDISVEAYPNPNSGDFMLTSTHSAQFDIVNELGQLIQKIELTLENGNRVKVGGLKPGVYFVTGAINQEVITKKVIVQ